MTYVHIFFNFLVKNVISINKKENSKKTTRYKMYYSCYREERRSGITFSTEQSWQVKKYTIVCNKERIFQFSQLPSIGRLESLIMWVVNHIAFSFPVTCFYLSCTQCVLYQKRYQLLSSYEDISNSTSMDISLSVLSIVHATPMVWVNLETRRIHRKKIRNESVEIELVLSEFWIHPRRHLECFLVFSNYSRFCLILVVFFYESL